MRNNQEIINCIKLLEEKLLDPKFRKSAEELIHIIDKDFIEIGSSGKIYNREDVIAALKAEAPVNISIKNFRIKILSDDIVMALYTTVNNNISGAGSISERSSVWKKREGVWHILFHQGTPAAKA